MHNIDENSVIVASQQVDDAVEKKEKEADGEMRLQCVCCGRVSRKRISAGEERIFTVYNLLLFFTNAYSMIIMFVHTYG